MFKKNSVVILLGAGASMDADIPHSQGMIDKIEELIIEDDDWKKYKPLYDYVKSAIYYAEGVKGKFGEQVQYNIERLVNTLDELSKKEDHPLYPFVGSWNPRLNEALGEKFEKIAEFRKKIVDQLINEWVKLRRDSKASYYQNFSSFQGEYNHPLRIFTLNYDLCLERACSEKTVETGFDADSSEWDWRLFEEEDSNGEPNIYYYKLHGSVNWERADDDTGKLVELDDLSSNAELIFGTSYKLQYTDPFLFFSFFFRKWTLDESLDLLISIGYGFGDEHINGIIHQALKRDNNRLLISVAPCKDENVEKKKIIDALNLPDDSEQIKIISKTAKEFLESNFTIDEMKKLVPKDEEELDFDTSE